jgi:hypothetical protein
VKKKFLLQFLLAIICLVSACKKRDEVREVVFTHQYSNSYIQVYPPPDELFYSRLLRYNDPKDTNLASVRVYFHNSFLEPSVIFYSIDGGDKYELADSSVILSFRKDARTVITKEIKLFNSEGNAKEYFMKISYDPKIIYEASGKYENIYDAFIIHQTNIYYVPFPSEAFPTYSISEAEKAEVHKEFDSELTDTKSDRERADRIAFFVLNQLSSHKGTPSDSMNRITPFRQYKRAICGSDAVWCSNMAEIFAYVCVSYGIPVRISILGFNHDITASPALLNAEGHTNTEVYDRKTKTWSMIDLSFNLLGATYKDQKLNTQDFYYLLNNPITNDNILINYYDEKNKTLSQIPVKNSPVYNSLMNYYKVNNKFIYPCKGVYLPL